MLIRKKYNVESAHIVRNCTSKRCSHSIHGHSAIIEVILESKTLDNAGMVYDFGLMKGTIKQFIDSMDHCYLLCDKDKQEFQEFIAKNCDRYITLPFNPSAECLAMFVFKYVDNILKCTTTNNGEGLIKVKSVKYHETATGYAEAFKEDIDTLWKPEWDNMISFSKDITNDWSTDLINIIINAGEVVNPKIEQQINL